MQEESEPTNEKQNLKRWKRIYNKHKIKILSYNLNLLPWLVTLTNPGHGYGRDRMILFLKQISDYDIIMMQEVFSTPHLPFMCLQSEFRRIAQSLGFKYILRGRQPSLGDLITKKKWTDSGLLILSRYRLVSTDDIIFTQAANLDQGAYKGVLFARIKISDTHLLVFNCHLQATHSDSPHYTAIRNHQLATLRTFILKKRILFPLDSWILCGDFNIDAMQPVDRIPIEVRQPDAPVDSDDYKAMMNILNPDKKMKDLLKIKFGYHPSTRPPREVISSLSKIFLHKSTQRLDYLFFTKGITDNSFHIKCLVFETVLKPFEVSGYPFHYLSDHFGIQTTLYIPSDITTSGSFSIPEDDHKSTWKLLSSNTLFIILCSSTILAFYYNIYKPYIIIAWATFYISIKRFERTQRKPKFIFPKPDIDEIESIRKQCITDTNLEQIHVPVITFDTTKELVLKYETLSENFKQICKDYSYKRAIGFRVLKEGHLGPFKWHNYDDLYRRVINFGSGLCDLGMKKGTPVAILAENSPEWIICSLACHIYGFITVPITGGGSSATRDILSFSKVSVLVCSRIYTTSILKLANEDRDRHTFPIPLVIQMEDLECEEYWMAEKMKIKLTKFQFVEKRGIDCFHNPPSGIKDDDLACLIYSYRANSEIKCVPLTHSNIVNMQRNLYNGFKLSGTPLTPKDIVLSVFPLSRLNEYLQCMLTISSGAGVGLLRNDSEFWNDAALLRPTILCCSPMDFVKFYVVFRIAVSCWGKLSQFLFHFLLERTFKSPKGSIYHYLINFYTRNLKKHIGDRLRLIFVHSKGSLPIPRKRFLQLVFGCPVAECHYRTEMGVVACTSPLLDRSFEDNTTGYPLCHIKLIPWNKDYPNLGEIWTFGKNVAKGYIGDDTKSRFSDGWYHTKEIGSWTPEGHLKIYGHMNDMLEPAEGKFVFSSHLESIYAESDFVHQIIILGRKHKPLVAILVPNYELLYRWAVTQNIKGLSMDQKDLYRSREVKQVVLNDLQNIAKKNNLQEHEEIELLYLHQTKIPSILLLQRQAITNQFSEIIDDMYKQGFTFKRIDLPTSKNDPDLNTLPSDYNIQKRTILFLILLSSLSFYYFSNR